MLPFFIVVSIIVMLALRLKGESQLMRIEWNKVSSFISFMVLFTFFKLGLMSYGKSQGQSLPGIGPELMGQSWRFMLVFWEDVVFGMSTYYVMQSKMSKKVKIPLVVLISTLFGLGHLYQGISGFVITSLYPYFLSSKYGSKYGFGTVMACHIIYDNMTYFTVIAAYYLL